MDVQDSERQHRKAHSDTHISEARGHANTATTKPPAPKGPGVLQFPASPDMMEMSELCPLGCIAGLLGQSRVRATDLTGQPLCWECLPVIPFVPGRIHDHPFALWCQCGGCGLWILYLASLLQSLRSLAFPFSWHSLTLLPLVRARLKGTPPPDII